MAAEHVEYNIYHDWQRGDSRLGAYNGAYPGTGSNEGATLPGELVAEASLKITFHLFVDQSAGTPDKLDCTGITPALYARPLNSAVAPLLLATPTVANLNEVMAIIPRNTIPAGWAAFNSVRVWLDLDETSTIFSRVYGDVTVIDITADQNEAPDLMEETPVSTQEITTTETLTTQPGWRTILIDTTGGAFTLTLPTPGTYDGQKLELLHIAGTANCTINPAGGTVNGNAGNFTMEPNDSIDLREWSSNWLARNPTLVIS